jgi:hypothetical protein
MGRTDGADDLSPMMAAYHEAGHAVAHKVAGGRVSSVKLTGRDTGVMTTQEHGPREGDLMGWLVMILAGQEAAARFLTHHGYSLAAGRRANHRGSHHDRARFRRYAQGSGISEAHARHEAERLVRTHWRRIDRTARKLTRSRHLSHTAI